MELVLVLAIALIVLGPKRLPGAGRAVGQSLREFKESIKEPRESLNELKESIYETDAQPATSTLLAAPLKGEPGVVEATATPSEDDAAEPVARS
jgi:sec-independent protein translocase protein TatA